MAGFFNLPKPKAFKIEPRFWDPEKEEREARDRRIKAELGLNNDNSGYRPFIGQGEFRKGFSKGRWSADQQRRRSNSRILILVILIALLLYFILT